MERKSQLNLMIKVAILGALAGAIMMMKFALPIFPYFLEIDLSDIPAVIGVMVLGPLAGVLIEGVKIVVNILLNGSLTFGVGEAANFVSGVAFILPLGLIYRKKKDFKGAVIGLIAGTLSLTVVMGITNYFIFIPLFAKAFNAPVSAYVDIAQKLPFFGQFVNNLLDMIIYSFVPFNMLKGILITVVTLVLYDFLVPALNKIQNT
jgi:riboflavin transporter